MGGRHRKGEQTLADLDLVAVLKGISLGKAIAIQIGAIVAVEVVEIVVALVKVDTGMKLG